jgi:hypothetical protein
MKILSCGAGMQSTALALMSCENKQKGMVHTDVPIYDAVIFCNLGLEPQWVYDQVAFISAACQKCGIPFYILTTHLYEDYIRNFGKTRVCSIPFWSIGEDGKKAKMARHCTIDYKILAIQKFFKHSLMGYRRYQRIRKENIGSSEMHIGFSVEEQSRSFTSQHPMLVNKFPLIQMGLERKDSYRYNLEVWGLDTKASACAFCPFHSNYFYQYIRENESDLYEAVNGLDSLLEERQSQTAIRSKIYISKSRKRICELAGEDFNDAETFQYNGRTIWNGF